MINKIQDNHLFMAGGGEMGKLTRQKDWSKTAVGEVDQWPQSLRTTLSIVLNSKFPMFIWWGPELVCFYNDAYRPSLGNEGKHPNILGMPAKEAWPEIWDIIKPMIDQVLNGGEAIWSEDQLIPIYRNNKLEDVYWTFCYSPVNDESGKVSGVLVTCTETTEKVKNLKKLSEINEQLYFTIESAELGTFDYQPLTNKLNANDRLKKWFGVTPDSQLILDDAIKTVAKKDQERVVNAINTTLDYKSGGLYDIEYSIIQPETSEEIIVLAKGRAWFNENNEAYRFNGTLQDVTEKVKARVKIEESEKKFRSLVEQAPLGIAIFKSDKFIAEMANDTYLQLVDKTRNEFIDKALFDTIPEVETQVKPLLMDVLNTGNPYYSQEFPAYLNRFGKKDLVYFNMVYHPLRDNNNEINSVIVIATEVTGLVNAKHKLAESEKQFRKLIMHSPIPMTIYKGKELIIEFANKRMSETIWRKDRKKVIGKKLLEAFPELKNQKYPELLQQVYNTGKACKLTETEVLLHGKDGLKKFFVDLEYVPMFDKENKVAGIISSAHDVSEKVEARKKIEESEQQMRSLVESAPFPIGVYQGKEMRIIMANQSIIETWGKGNKIIGKRYSEVLPELEGPVYHQLDKVFSTGVPFHARNQKISLVVNGEPKLFYFNYSFTPIFKSNGEIFGVMNTAADVTDLNIALKKIEKSESSFRLLADSMPQFVWSADKDGNLNYFNQSVYNYTGLNEEDFIKNGWFQFVHPDEIEKTKSRWKEAIATGKDFSIEHKFRRHDNEYRWQYSRAIALKDSNGKIQLWVGTSTEVHEQKIFANKLEQQVSERTKELEKKNVDLEKMNKELQSFAYISSHDLQEPLRKIQTFASRIVEKEYDNLTHYGKDYFNRMKESANRMQSLIDDLLTYSRTDRSERKFVKMQLGDIIDEVKEDLKEEIIQQKARIETLLLCEVEIIHFQFRQLFYNLISNSLKFSKTNTPLEIQIKSIIKKGKEFDIESLEKETSYCHISISDNGIGFDPKYKDKMFEVFQQLHVKKKYQGTGIGLAIVKKIVENHNGYVTATGKKNKGATFDIYIPAQPIA